MSDFLDPQALKELPGVFAHYDEEDAKAALLATMDLFRWIAVETAEKLGYPYPAKADEHVTKWIRTCLSQKRNARALKSSPASSHFSASPHMSRYRVVFQKLLLE